MTDNVFGVTPEPEENPAAEAAASTEGSKPESEERLREDEPEASPQEPAPAEPVEGAAVAEEDDERELLSPNPEEGFRIGNRTYKDIGSADRAFRQFAGRAQAEALRRKDIEQELARTRAELEAERSQRAQQAQTQEGKGSPAPAAPTPPTSPKRLTDLVSDEEFDALVAEHGPARAFRRLAELTDERLTQALEEATAPIKPILRQKEGAERTAQTFDHCASLKDDKGNAIFPEIVNPDSPEAAAVFSIWQRNISDPELAPLAFTPHGVRYAVLEYREANGQPASRAPRTAAGAAVASRRDADRSLQSAGTSGATGTRFGAPGPTKSAEERVQAALRARQHPVFGVTQEN